MNPLAQAIARQEGFGIPGNRPTRNNNPGNLRASSLAIGKDAGGFAIFASVADGWAALERQIGLDAGRGLNVAQFIAKHAPPSENDTSRYLANVLAWTGLSSASPLTTSASQPAFTPSTLFTAPQSASSGAVNDTTIKIGLGIAAAALVWLLVDSF